MNSQQKTEIQHITYSITQDDLLSMWMDLYHPEEHIVTIFEPVKHCDYLKKINLVIDDTHLYESKILTVQLADIDDAVWLCKKIPHETGPYVQLWSHGRLITDNIDK